MKNKFSKIMAMALASISLASFTMMGALAESTVITDGAWTATTQTASATLKTITVKNVEDTSDKLEVTAYQIVKGTYKDGKLTGYALCDAENAAIENIEKPTASEVTAIAGNVLSGTANLQGIRMTKAAGKSYTADVEAGLYVVIITGSDTVVYNPAVVAVNISSANDVSGTASGGEVSMNGEFEDFFNAGSSAYVKSGSSGFNKDITGSSKNNEGDTVAYGSEVSFVLNEMTIPPYTAAYKNTLKYEINDKLDADAFEGINSLSVKVGGTEVSAGSDTYTLTYNGENSGTSNEFTISFTDQYIRDNGGKSVEVTYSSVISDKAGLNFAENKNTGSLTYSNDPSDAQSAATLTDSTYCYTFGIGAKIDSEDKDNPDKTTYEINKVTKAGEGFEDTATGKRSKNPLGGAEFTLYSDEAFTTSLMTTESDENGIISFFGLDEGTYYLKETAAPSGYTLNGNEYKFDISAELDGEGIMTSYSILTYIKTETKGTDGSTVIEYKEIGSAVYTNEPAIETDDQVGNKITETVIPAEIPNTRIAQLPSTGGRGIILLTLGASVGMGVFLRVYLNSRKKRKSMDK